MTGLAEAFLIYFFHSKLFCTLQTRIVHTLEELDVSMDWSIHVFLGRFGKVNCGKPDHTGSLQGHATASGMINKALQRLLSPILLRQINGMEAGQTEIDSSLS